MRLVRLEGVACCSAQGVVPQSVAPRIVNDVSYVIWINHETHFGEVEGC